MNKLCQCLVGTVGLRGICEDPIECVNYLNDIPGISNQAFSYLRDIEKQTVEDVFHVVEGNGIDKLYYDLIARSPFRKKKKDKKHITGRFKKPCELIPNENCLIGFPVWLAKSDYLQVNLKSFKIHTESAQIDFLYVFDLDTGDLIETIEFETTGQGNFIFDLSNKFYDSCDSIFIAYDAANIQSCETGAKKYTCNKSCLACGCMGSGYAYKYTYATTASDANPCREDLIRHNEGGLILEYVVSCSFSKWMCDHKEQLVPILRLAMGLSFFDEVQGMLGKLNKLTLMPEESKEAIKDLIKDQYETAIDDFLSGLAADCCCFECKKVFSITQKLP